MASSFRNGILMVIFLSLAIFSVVLLSRSTSNSTIQNDRLTIVASFFPLAEFARAVGGEFVEVNTITPNGTEPHEYEPTPEQIAAVYDADVLLYNGGGVDAWADRLVKDLSKPTLELSTIDATTIVGKHTWLNPLIVQAYVKALANTFANADSAHTDAYQANAQKTIEKLEMLDQSYREGLSTCENRLIITSHNAFEHLSMLYHFEIASIAGFSPEEEPSAGHMADLVKRAKEKNVRVIFFESLVSPKLSETIAREVGAQTLVLNPLEGLTTGEQAAGKNYFSVMEENLANLRMAMVCQ